MKRIALVVPLVACLAGCPKEKAAAPDAAVPAAVAPQAEKGAFTLTPAMLDAYLAYQKAWVDSGPQGRPVDRATREQAALKASGLTDEQLNQIDAMVSAVIARRMVSQLTGNTAFNPDFAGMGEMAKALSPDQKKHMEDAVTQFKAQQQAAQVLTEERAQYGSQNIDVLLTKEAELTKMWTQMMGLGGAAGMPPPPALLTPDAGR